jgi:hypothetical protein
VLPFVVASGTTDTNPKLDFNPPVVLQSGKHWASPIFTYNSTDSFGPWGLLPRDTSDVIVRGNTWRRQDVNNILG